MKYLELIIIAWFITIISCDKQENSNAILINSHPMTAGTEWHYEQLVIIKQYESETSDIVIDSDTIKFNLKVWVEKDTMLEDTMPVTIFKSQRNDVEWISSYYKFVDSDGLKTYAFANPGPTILSTRNNAILKSASPEFLSSIMNPSIHQNDSQDDINIEHIPSLDIKLPLDMNSYWTYRHPSEPINLQIDKEVTGIENLEVNEQNFLCYKVQWHYSGNDLYDEINIVEWISEYGLVKQRVDNNRITITAEDGVPFEGEFQFTELFILKNFYKK